MSIGLIFWVLMLIWLIFGVLSRTSPVMSSYPWAGDLLIFILLFLLGWHAFGFMVHQ
jgi:hypothetical protein